MKTMCKVLIVWLAAAAWASLALGGASAELTLSGGVEGQFSGQALHMAQSMGDEQHLLLALYDYRSDDDFTAVTVIFPGPVADVGIHEIRDEGFEGPVIALMQVRDGETFFGSPAPAEFTISGGDDAGSADATGELVIETAVAGALTGTLRFSGDYFNSSDPGSMVRFTLEARFNSVAGTASDLPGMLGVPAMEEF